MEIITLVIASLALVAVIVAIMGAIYIAENGKAKLSRLEKADSEK